MSGILIVAAVLPILFGLALVGSVVLERRQAGLRQRIGHSIGLYSADLGETLGATLRLDARRRAEGILGWLPESFGGRIEGALGATGDRVTTFHVVIAGCVGAVLAQLFASLLLD